MTNESTNTEAQPGSLQRMVRRHGHRRGRYAFWRIFKYRPDHGRWPHELPLGFGYVLDTDKYTIRDHIFTIAQSPKSNQADHRYRRKLEFFQRWIDPVILPLATSILWCLDRLVRPGRPRTPKGHICSEDSLCSSQRARELVMSPPSPSMLIALRLKRLEKDLGDLRSIVSSYFGIVMPSNESNSATAQTKEKQ